MRRGQRPVRYIPGMNPTKTPIWLLVATVSLAASSLAAASFAAGGSIAAAPPRADTPVAIPSPHYISTTVGTLSGGPGRKATRRSTPSWLTVTHPIALADTTLPRLADFNPADRRQLALALKHKDISTRVACYAFLQVGTPYELGPLGEGAPPDTQPVLQFKTTDCTTINLVSAALAHADEMGGEQRAIALANYRGGVISYATRFHFTTDRLDASPYFRDITRRAGGNACRHQVVTLNQRANGSHWIPIDWTREREVFYVPRERGAEFEHWFHEHRIPPAMGIAFVKAAKLRDGLDVVHESMLWRGHTLLHASSLSGRVIMLPWRQFLEESGAQYDGFVLFEYR